MKTFDRLNGNAGLQDMTTQPAQVAQINDGTPEFGRWREVERIFGIKRGTLYTLVAEGKIKAVSLRRKGCLRGCRLFYLPSIAEYLRGLLRDQNPANLGRKVQNNFEPDLQPHYGRVHSTGAQQTAHAPVLLSRGITPQHSVNRAVENDRKTKI